ncbi:GNAT family N-acetyltransferase [Virgibacillus phasianinus]|uniref:GNAT family N-acetyltransferase n=1 Tax=Virgibacillus phasianinus TaxID=2017483 RepID=A0A220U812_9BACI|nr:N-acetyltransferase [Virgibacillus phasianinus]ASK64175.1 GNAT family N-acetyltransferase [Virgibacillus phasianinus]
MNFIIRQEQKSDYELTEKVVEIAFASADQSDENEHELVSRIRQSEVFIPELSLVAVSQDNDEILGHILLSKVLINNGNQKVESLALAPVSVLPDYQNKGIGRALIQKALEKAKKLGFQSVIVLGHPDYYPKFGFRKSSQWRIKAPFEVPEEALMAIELQEDSLNNVSGVIEYPGVFFL